MPAPGATSETDALLPERLLPQGDGPPPWAHDDSRQFVLGTDPEPTLGLIPDTAYLPLSDPKSPRRVLGVVAAEQMTQDLALMGGHVAAPFPPWRR